MRTIGALLALVGLQCCLISAENNETNALGKTFLAANTFKPGVVTLPSGLQYKVLEKGDGVFHPKEDSRCLCEFEGWMMEAWPDGEPFESSYANNKTVQFQPNELIKGMGEAIQLMVEGATWELYIPAELAYGDKGYGERIPGGEALVFKLLLVKIKGAKKSASGCDTKTFDGCTEKETGYIKLKMDLTKAEISEEITRLDKLGGVDGKKLSTSAENWRATRQNLLSKLRRAKDEL